jgi:hypothetical protein
MAGFSVIALLMFIMGMISIMWGIALSEIGGMSWLNDLVFLGSRQAWGSSALGFGTLSILIGIVEIITSFGLFARKNWARMAALITSGISIAISLLGLIRGSFFSLLGVVLPAAVIFYLLSNRQAKKSSKKSSKRM